MSREQLLDLVLRLPQSEQVWLADEILSSLNRGGSELSADEWNDVWADELERRISEMESSERGVPFDELISSLRRELGTTDG